ncbi:MAG: alpha/beta fold hydrolase [Longimicrobiaceae bacterium]
MLHPIRPAALLLLLSTMGAVDGGAPQPGLQRCSIDGVEGEVRCGVIRVSENPGAPRGRQLSLRVVVLRARSSPAEPDAVFYLSGGPGQAATAGAAAVARELAEVRERRDVVLVDQRGTGPDGLQCSLGRHGDAARAWVTGDFPPGRLEACRRRWGADLRFYLTVNYVEDLERARAALGYARVDLVGVSYGTRPALAYLRRYPERVRTLTLRGVYPPSAPLPLNVARDAQAVLDRLAADHPALPGDVARALARANSAPARLPVEGGREKGDTLVVTRDVLAGSLLMALYGRAGAEQVPAAARAAAEGRPEALVSIGAGAMLSLAQTLSPGLYLSVVCSEDVVQIRPGEGAAPGTFLGDLLVRNLERVCASWPRGRPPAGYTEPVRSDVPALVISGDADPVTPPRWGALVASTLPRGAHLVLAGEGHIPSFPPCARRATAELITAGSAASIDLACGGRTPAASPPPSDTGAVVADSTGPLADVAGRWAMFWITANGPRESGWLVIRQEGARVTAELHGQGSIEAEGTIRGSLLVLSGRRMLVPFELRAAARGDTLTGVLRVLSLRRPFTAVRR